MDAMKDALSKRKSAIQHGFKISIDLEPAGATSDDMEKKLGMAPSVKDAESPKEPKLIPQVEIEAAGHEGSPEEELLESPKVEQEEDVMNGSHGLPELPIGREPKGLHEMAAQNMMNQKSKLKHKK